MANVKGSENISSTVPTDLAKQIIFLAGESGLTTSKYVRALLVDAAARRRIFRVRHEEFCEETPPTGPVNYRLNDAPKTSRK
jgi:hypothetical protein